MPLVKGASRDAIRANIAELHGGKTYAKTAAKYGKKKANAQSVAIAMDTARKAGKK